jgi:predicted methyltransferase
MLSHRTLAFAIALASAACGPNLPPDVATTTKVQSDEAAIRSAVAMPHRSEANRKRDVYRHPIETLSFFGLKPDMTVVEMFPGQGWYTEILAPLLADHGKLIVTTVDTSSYTGGPQDKPGVKAAHDLQERFKAQPELFGKVQVTRIDPPNNFVLGPDNSADMVLTFRSVHDWVRDGVADKVFAAMFKVLKPGGTLGLVAHVSPNADAALAGKTGYLQEPYVIELAKKAGFTLAARSDVNANPKDTHDWPEGVWTLPPTYRLGDKNRDLYAMIGESDRMTLRFVKPGKP